MNKLDSVRMFLAAQFIIYNCMGSGENGHSLISTSNKMTYSMEIYKNEVFFLIIYIVFTLITLFGGKSIMYYQVKKGRYRML